LDTYLYASSHHLTIGTATASKEVIIHTGGLMAANEIARFASTGLTLYTGMKLTTPLFKMTTGAAAGAVLVSDVNGDATWKPLNDSMYRQAIINGNFDVWQRGTSATATAAAGLFLADRWRESTIVDGGTNPTLTRSRGILNPGELFGSYYYSRLTTNGAGSSYGVNSRYYYLNPIEHGNRFLCGDGKKVTVSFWARSSIANKKLGLGLYQAYGSGGSPSAGENINGTNWTLTSNWVKYTHTFTTNTLSGKTFGTDNNDVLSVAFQYIWGSSQASLVGAGTTAETFVGAGTIDIAQVQLCAGDVALPFMPKSVVEELSMCQRYYEKSDMLAMFSGNVTSGQNYYFSVPYKVTKRISVTPTLTTGGNSSFPATNSVSFNNGIGGFVSQRTANGTGTGYFWDTWTADAEL